MGGVGMRSSRPLLQNTVAEWLMHSRQFYRFVWQSCQRNEAEDSSITP